MNQEGDGGEEGGRKWLLFLASTMREKLWDDIFVSFPALAPT